MHLAIYFQLPILWPSQGAVFGKREFPLGLETFVDTVHHVHEPIEIDLRFFFLLDWGVRHKKFYQGRKFGRFVPRHRWKEAPLAGTSVRTLIQEDRVGKCCES